jgi:type I restriction-modification system DNA methylase subunit
MTEVSIKLIDEIAIIFLWIGIWGIADEIIYSTMVFQYKKYIYTLLILSAIYMKI